MFKNWIRKERINIDSIVILNPQKEVKIFIAYSLFYILLIYLVSITIKRVPMPILNSTQYLCDWWYLVFGKIIFLLTVPLVIYKKLGYQIKQIFDFKHKTLRRNIIVVLTGILLGVLINIPTLARIVIYHEKLHITAFNTFVGLMMPLFLAALPEEIFYRYILQTRIEKFCGWGWSILISSILFALFHFPSRYVLATGGFEGVAGNFYSIILGVVIPNLIIGITFAFTWNRYRNIFLLIGFHYGIDLFSLLASFWGLKL